MGEARSGVVPPNSSHRWEEFPWRACALPFPDADQAEKTCHQWQVFPWRRVYRSHGNDLTRLSAAPADSHEGTRGARRGHGDRRSGSQAATPKLSDLGGADRQCQGLVMTTILPWFGQDARSRTSPARCAWWPPPPRRNISRAGSTSPSSKSRATTRTASWRSMSCASSRGGRLMAIIARRNWNR